MKEEIIYYQCPDCPNNEFEIIKVLAAAKVWLDKKRKGLGNAPGFYRCKCTACGLIQTFKSKTPAASNEYHED